MTELQWERVQGQLQEALDYGHETRTLEDVRREVETGRMQLWRSDDSAMITQLLTHDSGTVECSIFIAGGSLEGLQALLPEVETFARRNRATCMTVLGRKGWERSFLVRESGYTPMAVLFRKDLDR